MSQNFDIIVIGGGPGGYVAAIKSSQLGFKTALVEKDHIGGICLNWGCIPTKALLKSSEIAELLSHINDYGFSIDGFSVDFEKIIKRSRNVAKKLTMGIDYLMKKNHITVFEGKGVLNGNKDIRLFKKNGKTDNLSANNIIIATGARAKELPNLKIDNEFVWDYKKAMLPKKQPKSLLIVGSGAIGCEFANFYSALGTKVTLLEIADNILPIEDKEISSIARKAFKKKNIDIFTNSTISKINTKDGISSIEIKNCSNSEKHILKTDNIISAVGIIPNIENIGLETTDIKLGKRGHIVTDSYCRTDEDNIYAIGDVTSPPWLAHKASHEAIIALNHISKNYNHKIKKENIPSCTYTNPQIASIGITEEEAKKQKLNFNIGRCSFSANGKSIAMGLDNGLIKVISEKETGEILGVHMIGVDVTELIHSFALAKNFEATIDDLTNTIFPHPTLSEMIYEACLDTKDQAIHS